MNADSNVTGPVTFMNRTYDEAIALLLEVRTYLAHQEVVDREGLRPIERLSLSLETTRMTAMLTHAIAWLMIQKAAAAGEITRTQAASPENRLGGKHVCLDVSAASDERMPSRLRELLTRCHHLYVRVNRLDQLVAQGA